MELQIQAPKIFIPAEVLIPVRCDTAFLMGKSIVGDFIYQLN